MAGSIVLGSSGRKRLLELYRWTEAYPSEVRLRAHVVLLLANEHPWSLIESVLYCSRATLARWRREFESGGVDELLTDKVKSKIVCKRSGQAYAAADASLTFFPIA